METQRLLRDLIDSYRIQGPRVWVRTLINLSTFILSFRVQGKVYKTESCTSLTPGS